MVREVSGVFIPRGVNGFGGIRMLAALLDSVSCVSFDRKCTCDIGRLVLIIIL